MRKNSYGMSIIAKNDFFGIKNSYGTYKKIMYSTFPTEMIISVPVAVKSLPSPR